MIRQKWAKALRRTFVATVGAICVAQILPPARAQTISTYAGGGGYVNAPPLSVAMQAPAGLAVGPAGGIYVAVREHSPYNNDAAFDTNESNEVFRIDPATGKVTRVVGNGVDGASGVGGAPTAVSLNDPQGLAFDNAGNLYIADAGNNRVLKVSADPAFDPADPTALAGGPITARSVVSVLSTAIAHPVSVAFDPTFSSLYVASSTGSSIEFSGVVKLSMSGRSTTVVAGCIISYTPGCTFQSVNGLPATKVAIVPDGGNSLAFDAAGNLYIASSSQYGLSGIVRVNGVDGTLTAISGTGPSSGGSCSKPATAGTANLGTLWMAFDGAGDLLLADRVNDVVCRISPDPTTGTIDSNSPIISIAGRGTFAQGSASYGQPGYGDGGPAGEASFFRPDGIAVGPTGDVFVSDASEGRVRKISVDPATGIVDADSVISTAAGSGGRSNENAGAVGGDGNLATSATMNGPAAVALDAAGDLFVGSDGVIRRVDATTHIISTVAGHLGPAAPSCPPSFEDGEPATCASFSGVGGAPVGLAVDSAGNIYVSGLYTVKRIDTSGDITTVAGGGSGIPGSGCGDNGPAIDACLYDVHGLAFDQQGDLYIADTGDNEIREVTPDGIIRTVAGTGQANPTSYGTTTCTGGGECAGDGGPAVDAPLQQPMYLVWQPTPNLVVQLAQQGSTPIAVGGGTLYFTDSGNGVIRVVDLYTDTISTLDYFDTVLDGDYGVVALCDHQTVCGRPTGIAMDVAGNLFLSSNNGNDAIWKVPTPERTSVPAEPWVTWLTAVEGMRFLTIPDDVTANRENPFGTFVGDGGFVGDATVSDPQALAIDSKGDLYVADEHFHRVRVIKGVARARGDVNGDGQVDKVDLGLIMNALNTPANGLDDLRDLNHDGVVNLLDARILVTLCTYPGCATQP